MFKIKPIDEKVFVDNEKAKVYEYTFDKTVDEKYTTGDLLLVGGTHYVFLYIVVKYKELVVNKKPKLAYDTSEFCVLDKNTKVVKLRPSDYFNFLDNIVNISKTEKT